MKVSYSWLKDFVDVRLKPRELAKKLTMAGLSVDHLSRVAGDWVYEIEITSNRPDWLSVRGIAREVAAVTHGRPKDALRRAPSLAGCRPSLAKAASNKGRGAKTGIGPALKIHIEDTKDCQAYCGVLIKDVKVGPSPAWLARRLETLGVRCVNNVVDITNYCLLEHGQPLHAFDFDRFRSPSVVVRRARRGERIVLINESETTLNPGVLVITDGVGPVAVAGVMGGSSSEVGKTTNTVLLESAYFDPVVVRRGTRMIGVSSDSSYRFERGVSLEGVRQALAHAARLICDLCGGMVVTAQYAGTRQAPKPHKVTFSMADVCDVLSVKMKASVAKKILQNLGFGVKAKTGGVFEVSIPAYRRDVRIAEDITEEIARVYGYEKIPLSSPAIRAFTMREPATQALEDVVRQRLVAVGLKEAVTYSLISKEDYCRSGLVMPQDVLRLDNPLNADRAILRTTVIPGLLECVSTNASRNRRDLEIFELAHTFATGQERLSLGIVLAGKRRAAWKKEAVAYTFFDLKGILEVLLDDLQVKAYTFEREQTWGIAEQGTGCRIQADGKEVARLAKVAAAVKKAWDIKSRGDVFIAELDINALVALADLNKSFTPVSATPSILRDISLLVGSGVSFSQIEKVIREEAGTCLKDVSLLDYYQGREVTEGTTGLTISVEYQDKGRTLTDNEVNPVHQRILKRLSQDLSLTIR